jgi:hypothetical protein
MTAPKCETCGASFIRWSGEFCPPEYCRRGHPPRGAQVSPGVPPWLRTRLNAAFPREIRAWIRCGHGVHRTTLGSKSEAWSFLANFTGEFSGSDSWDHFGHDAEDNLITEPYADRAEIEPRVAAFAAAISVKYSITEPSYHDPGHCLRITFFRPEQS